MKQFFITLILIFFTGIVTYIFVPRPYQVHWHANFAVYIDGKMQDFSKDIYMEETSRCNIGKDVRPQDRIHLHDNKGGLVHVHMAASTWGDLFANLFYSIGSTYIANPYTLYKAENEKVLFYFLNGKAIINPANMAVKSEDRLLVWYGTGTEQEVEKQFDTLVPKDAHEYNGKADPASCRANVYGDFLGPIIEKIQEFLPHDHN